ncbi:hypothetical protein KXD97_26290 [Mycobacterium sp. SMC-8]|uniref:hypothetical protein n=1 Tax=Mycobacterium sp. SMC-8 TaxID=2857060 RepID=UPI0021B19EF1|nr:hypothetical protein [Mycobacterium sp. SMC-8]UXA11483.1 hypothetical protein KXD97_26290 [Mycobacterium sp. SMC-8]
MNRKADAWFAWSGIAFVGLFVVGMVGFAGFVPPPSPTASAEEIAAIFRDNTNGIRFGLILVFVATVVFFFYGAEIAHQTRRITAASRALSYVQIATVSAAALIIDIPVMLWWVAAFRPERSAESIQMLNDIAWMIFIVGFVPYVAWAFAVGIAILSDVAPEPIYPRWSGYLSIFVGLAQMPPVMLVFFKTGPFAWDGLISWWVPAVDFFGWAVVMIVLTGKAARRELAESQFATDQVVPISNRTEV